MFNQDVQIAFSLAVREAQRRRHEFLTTEHVLYAMLFDEQGQEILRACGGDIDSLREDLEMYLGQHRWNTRTRICRSRQSDCKMFCSGP